MADYLKLPDVARRLDVSEKTARRMVRSGKLPAVFIGGAYRVSDDDLTEYLANARVEPGKAPAPPALQQSFNDLLEEERRARYLQQLELSARIGNDWWHKELERNEFDVADYHHIGDDYFEKLDAALASAMTEEVAEDAAWNRAFDAVESLRNTLQRAREQLVARLPEDEVPDVPEVPVARDEVAERRDRKARMADTGHVPGATRSSKAG